MTHRDLAMLDASAKERGVDKRRLRAIRPGTGKPGGGGRLGSRHQRHNFSEQYCGGWLIESAERLVK